MAERLVVTVEEIEGHCPVYSEGQRIVLEEGYRINLEETDAVCMHSLASLLPYYAALSWGVSPGDLGLAGREEGVAYFQCLDPCRITGGGTVLFSVRRRPGEKEEG